MTTTACVDALPSRAPRHRHPDRSGLMVPVVRPRRGARLWGSAAEIARLADGGPRRHGDARGAHRLDDHDHQPRRARRHRHDAGDQPPRGGDHRRQQDRRRARCARRRVVPRQMMNLSSSFDHRVVDGSDAAAVHPGASGRCWRPRRCSGQRRPLRNNSSCHPNATIWGALRRDTNDFSFRFFRVRTPRGSDGRSQFEPQGRGSTWRRSSTARSVPPSSRWSG